jgi:hypothetical protein
MRILSYPECAEWCTARGFPIRQIPTYAAGPEPDLESGDFHVARFDSPRNAERLVGFAQCLYAFVDPSPEVLIWFGDWAVWPSSQHMPLFTRFRQSLGEVRPLIEAPGQLLAPEEAEDAISMITMALLFSWDVYLLSDSGRDAVFVSHDDWGWFASLEAARVEEVRKESSGAFE